MPSTLSLSQILSLPVGSIALYDDNAPTERFLSPINYYSYISLLQQRSKNSSQTSFEILFLTIHSSDRGAERAMPGSIFLHNTDSSSYFVIKICLSNRSVLFFCAAAAASRLVTGLHSSRMGFRFAQQIQLLHASLWENRMGTCRISLCVSRRKRNAEAKNRWFDGSDRSMS